VADLVPAVLVGGEAAFGDGIAAALDAPVLRLGADELEDAGEVLAGRLDPGGLVWMHLVPSSDTNADDVFAEASLLVRSARVARELAAAAAVPVTFVAVLPSPGLFTGPRGEACDIALTTTTSLMRTQIGTWSSEGRRFVGVVYAGVDAHAPVGQRSLDAVRQRTPMGMLASFEHLAGALRYVGSARASYLTGTLLRVDGGWDAYSWIYPARTI
jgi:hypothetical protein